MCLFLPVKHFFKSCCVDEISNDCTNDKFIIGTELVGYCVSSCLWLMVETVFPFSSVFKTVLFKSL